MAKLRSWLSSVGLMLFVFTIIGAFLLRMTALYETRVDDRAMHAVTDGVLAVDPGLTVPQSRDIERAVASWRALREREPVGLILARDVGIAFLVAVILTAAMEWHARNHLMKEVMKNVLQAVYERLMPDGFFDVVKASVFQSTVMKDNWAIRMTLAPPVGFVLPANVYVSTTEVLFDLRNRTPGHVTEMVTWDLDDDVQLGDNRGSLPRFLEIGIGDKSLSEDEIKDVLSKSGLSFTTKLLLKQAPTRVRMKVLELIRVPDTFCWHTAHCTSMASITINTDAISDAGVAFTVRAIHPHRDQMRVLAPGQEWVFNCAMLPFHSIEFKSSRRKPSSAIAVGAVPAVPIPTPTPITANSP